MDNKVGDNVPNETQLAQLLAQVEAAVTELKKFCVTLSPDARARLLHARNEADPHVRAMYGLARKYNQSIPGMPVEGMLNDLQLSTRILPFRNLLKLGEQLAADTAAEAEHEYWQTFLAYYGVLTALSASIPELAIEMRPIVDFMAVGSSRKKPDVK